jgi:exopolyphosphatase/guanosine-5'-triphosphate,3'-diphosphate pyrophosphatase
LHIIHEYSIPRRPAEGFLDIIAGQSRRSLERIASINRKRLELVPLAALILRDLIAAGRPERIVFSAFGLREGYAAGLLPPDPLSDPLIAAAMGIAASQSRGGGDGERLQRWTAGGFPDLDERARRLHRAACWLSDFAWTEHPDYRAEHAFIRSLRMPVAQINHRERVFVALALHARYGGAGDDPVKAATSTLVDDGAAGEARSLGLALRLAYTLCGGALELLDEVRLARDANGIVLELPPTGSLFIGEVVQRRLDALGRALGLQTRTERRRNPSPALA